jgi:diphthine-ammonia ligase
MFSSPPSPSVCSFSGGKDSCLALWRAQQQGIDVRALLVMFEETGERSRSHAIPLPLIERQASALQLDLTVRRASWTDYESVFITALQGFKARGFGAAVFGDIDLQAHRDWEEKVCKAAGMDAVLPLWHHSRDELAREVLALAFKAVVVCVDSRYLGDEFCGRPYDEAFLADLPAGVDACGENGEFHTFVHDGPNFRAPVDFSIERFEAYVAPQKFGGARYCFVKLR